MDYAKPFLLFLSAGVTGLKIISNAIFTIARQQNLLESLVLL
jgi:hypothetical protein